MNTVVYSGILIELMIVAWIDLRFKKISNLWIGFNFLFSLLLHIFLTQEYPWSWELLYMPAGFIIVGFFLFLVGVMGAGDSKYLASLYLLIPLEFHFSYFEKLLTSTIMVGLILVMFRLITRFADIKSYLVSGHWKGILQVVKSRFSYAPIMLLAWFMLGVDLWN